MTKTMADAQFSWSQQNNYSWRGSYQGTPYWVILTADHKNYILQIPGLLTENNDLNNISFGSFEDAKKAAENSVN
jgi:hypothetical protein